MLSIPLHYRANFPDSKVCSPVNLLKKKKTIELTFKICTHFNRLLTPTRSGISCKCTRQYELQSWLLRYFTNFNRLITPPRSGVFCKCTRRYLLQSWLLRYFTHLNRLLAPPRSRVFCKCTRQCLLQSCLLRYFTNFHRHFALYRPPTFALLVRTPEQITVKLTFELFNPFQMSPRAALPPNIRGAPTYTWAKCMF